MDLFSIPMQLAVLSHFALVPRGLPPLPSNPTHPQIPLKRCLLPKVFIAWKSDLPPLPPRLGLSLCVLPSNAGICEQTFFPLWGRKRPLRAEGDPWLIYLQIPSTNLDQRRAQ